MSDTLVTGADISMQPEKEFVQVTRRMLVQVKNTLGELNRMGHEAATWKPMNHKVGEVFGVHDLFEATPDVGTAATF